MQSQPENQRSYFAETFKDQHIVDAYQHRPPYPDEVFKILMSLMTDEPRTLLDIGAGSGDIARQLVDFVERVDAVDFSENMLERGKQLPSGNAPNMHWICGKPEEVPLSPPYALITAGSSIHWMEWEKVFPLFRAILTPRGCLALVYRRTLPMPWGLDVRKLRAQFLPWGDHRPRHVLEELEARGFFLKQGEIETSPVPFSQTIADFIESLHSHFSPEQIGPQKAAEFDQQLHTLLWRHHPDGVLLLQVVGQVIWGTPGDGKANGQAD